MATNDFYSLLNPSAKYGGYISNEYEKPEDFLPGGKYYSRIQSGAIKTSPQAQTWMGNNTGQYSMDGVSAVNPQAGQANELDAFKRYEDSAFNSALSRLEPQWQQQNNAFNQGLVSRGIPVGSDAYNSALGQLKQSQGDSLQNAAFGAMNFGLGAQNQSFQQSHARSALANALMQAQWQKALGERGLDLGFAQLGQRKDEFGKELGLARDRLGFDYDTLGQRGYEFDTNADLDYWDRGNFWDYTFGRADADDYRWATDAANSRNTYDDALFWSLFGQPAPGVAPANPYAAYGAQLGTAQRPGFDLLKGLGVSAGLGW